MIQYLLSIGALEHVFDDEDGDPVYRMTPEAQDMVPDLYEEHIKEFNVVVFSLWEKEMLDVTFDEDGSPMIGINENSLNEEMYDKLERDEREALQEILIIWKRKSEG